MSPELNRSDDRGEELATTEQSAEPAAGPEPGQAADRERDAADAHAMEPAADQTEGALLADAGLRADWQRIQVGFVDDPREAVADAANLVEHAAQAFVGALQQRQRRFRDPSSGVIMRVWVDPGDDSRHYVPDDAPTPG